jgi:hypothetical protein
MKSPDERVDYPSKSEDKRRIAERLRKAEKIHRFTSPLSSVPLLSSAVIKFFS